MRLVLEGLKRLELKLELPATAGATLSETGWNRKELPFLSFPTFNIPLMTPLGRTQQEAASMEVWEMQFVAFQTQYHRIE